MFNYLIEIYSQGTERDEYNEVLDVYRLVYTTYAQKTEHGGKENLFASRITYENEISYTIRYSPLVMMGMFIKIDGKYCKITTLSEEGRNYRQHLKITTDA